MLDNFFPKAGLPIKTSSDISEVTSKRRVLYKDLRGQAGKISGEQDEHKRVEDFKRHGKEIYGEGETKRVPEVTSAVSEMLALSTKEDENSRKEYIGKIGERHEELLKREKWVGSVNQKDTGNIAYL